MPRTMPRDTVAGAGFIALDILLASKQDRQLRRRAGGTCGNVLAILSFLGHASVLIARLGTDKAADLIMSDLKSTGVDCQHVQRDSSGRTPRVVEFLPDRPGSTHRFAFTCPMCQRRFPRRSEPIYEQGHESIHQIKPALFFFDRSGPTTIKLAMEARESGALVMFEPHSFGSNGNFSKALQISDVVKVFGSPNWRIHRTLAQQCRSQALACRRNYGRRGFEIYDSTWSRRTSVGNTKSRFSWTAQLTKLEPAIGVLPG